MFIRLCVLLFLCSALQVAAQDKLVLEDGSTKEVRVIKHQDKIVYYKYFDDPEFITQQLPESSIDKIIYEDGRIVVINHNPAGFILFGVSSVQPLGKYTSSDIQSGNAGLAQNGGGLELTAGYYLKPRFALTFGISGFNNWIDSNAYKSFLAAQYPSYTTKLVGTSDWKCGMIHIGGRWSFPITSKLFVHAELRAIRYNVTSSGFSYKIQKDSTTHAFSQGTDSKVVFGLSPGLGAQYMLSSRWGIHLHSNYFRMRPTFTNSYSLTTTSTTNTSTTIYNNRSQLISNLSVLLGIAYYFY